MTLTNSKIGAVVTVNGEEFVKVAKNYWKSRTTELFEPTLEARISEEETKTRRKKREKTELRDNINASDTEKEE